MPRKGTWLGFAVAGAGTYYLYSISENQNKASHHFAGKPSPSTTRCSTNETIGQKTTLPELHL